MMSNTIGNTSIQTYGQNGKVSTDTISNAMSPNDFKSQQNFEDLLLSKLTEPLKAANHAEQAVILNHNGQISQDEFNMVMNEAQIQLTEFKATIEKSLTALQEVLRSTAS